MASIIHETYDIQPVREIQPCDRGLQVVFSTDLSACLRREHPDHERMRHHAQSSLRYGGTVGFRVAETGDLVELNDTHQSTVRHVRIDEEDPSRLMVEFWAYSPICYVTKDHPDYERLKHTLERAAATDEPVTFANHLHMVESETETWWKLLDVRPAFVPPAATAPTAGAPANWSHVPDPTAEDDRDTRTSATNTGLVPNRPGFPASQEA